MMVFSLVFIRRVCDSTGMLSARTETESKNQAPHQDEFSVKSSRKRQERLLHLRQNDLGCVSLCKVPKRGQDFF
jgi:hypothetical protein